MGKRKRLRKKPSPFKPWSSMTAMNKPKNDTSEHEYPREDQRVANIHLKARVGEQFDVVVECHSMCNRRVKPLPFAQ